MPVNPIAAEGGVSTAQDRLCAMIADCPSFQALAGCNTAAEALERCHSPDLPLPITQDDGDVDAHGYAELQRLRPFALVTKDRRQGGYRAFMNAYDTQAQAGRLFIAIEANVDCEDAKNTQVLFRKFENFEGKFCHELLERRNQPGFLGIDEVQTFDGPWRSEADLARAQGDHMFITFLVTWGAGSQ